MSAAVKRNHEGNFVDDKRWYLRESVWPAISLESALSIIRNEASLDPIVETVTLQQIKLGDIIAQDITAARAYPSARTSVKDGYAVIASDRSEVRVICGSSSAGFTSDVKLEKGFAFRVNTGSVIPEGADAVIPVEQTEISVKSDKQKSMVRIFADVRSGLDIRAVGSDVRKGQIMMETGTRIAAAEIGILIASEKQLFQIYKRPKVAVISTGDEIVDCNFNYCPDGFVRDTNRPQLIALFTTFGFEPIDFGIVSDREENLISVLENAFAASDVVVTTGGVSMGTKDLLKDVIQDHFKFKIHFGRVFMKPGLPTTFATSQINGRPKLLFGLPGNPLSAWVTSHVFVIPKLKDMAGSPRPQFPSIAAKLAADVQLDPRPEYRLSRLITRFTREGELPQISCLDMHSCTMSSRILSTVSANALIKLPSKSEVKPMLKKNEIVDVILIGPL